MGSYLLKIITLLLSLSVIASCADCVLSAIMSVYQCDSVCENIYGTDDATQRAIFDPVLEKCIPKTKCEKHQNYFRNNNTCIDIATLVNYSNPSYQVLHYEDKWIPIFNKTKKIQTYCVHGDAIQGRCRCRPGYLNPKDYEVSPDDSNILVNKLCSIQDPNPENYGLTPGEIKFNSLSYQEQQFYLIGLYGLVQDQPWVQFCKRFGIGLAVLYFLIGVLTVYQIRARRRKRQKKRKQAVFKKGRDDTLPKY